MAEIILFKKQLFFTMLKKPKYLDRELKIWCIVENGQYFENIKKNLKKLMIGCKNGGGNLYRLFALYTLSAPTVVHRVNLSKQNVDVMLTSHQCHINVCKSILDVNMS